MVQTEKELINDIKNRKFKPVYLLTGEESYYIDTVSDYLETHVVEESFRDFDQSVVYGRDVSMLDVVTMALQFPMLSPVKLVLVKEAQDIDTREWDRLVGYLEKPQESTVLVFCYRNKKLDKRSKAFKSIDKVGVVYERNKLRDNELGQWIARLVNQQGYQITEKAAVMIAEFVGNNLSKINNELSKLFVLLPKGSVINEDVVEKNIGISKDYNIFELQNAIGRKDVAMCNKIINYFASNPKTTPIQMMLPTLYGYFIKVMLYHQLPDKSKAAQVLKVNQYFVRDYETASRNYSLGKLASCIGYLHQADKLSKGIGNSGTITDGDIMKDLIFRILH